MLHNLHCFFAAVESDGKSNQSLCEILPQQQQDNANPSCLQRSHLSICKKVKSPVIFDLIGKHQSGPTVTTTHETTLHGCSYRKIKWGNIYKMYIRFGAYFVVFLFLVGWGSLWSQCCIFMALIFQESHHSSYSREDEAEHNNKLPAVFSL